MPNPENLIPNSQRTKEELSKMGKNGAKKTNAKKRKKKEMKEQMETLLAMDCVKKSTKKAIAELGIPEEDASNQMALIIALFNKAASGDLPAIKYIAEITGNITEKERAEIDAIKAKAKTNDKEEKQDDGFLEALSDTAEDDWSDE